MKTPRRCLVSLHQADKVMLPTPLLRWYLEHGLKVARIYKVMQFRPRAWLKHVGDDIIQTRRAGDTDPQQAVIAALKKLFGNSLYGKTVTDKSKHLQIRYSDDRDVQLKMNDCRFRHCEPLKEGYYEVQMAKRRIKYDLPNIMGFFVYAYAKMAMLQFVYDFMDVYIDESQYQFLQMDTVSAVYFRKNYYYFHILKAYC